jgi:1-acyl-sn-glycerol-3-phosphate acyltransferase
VPLVLLSLGKLLLPGSRHRVDPLLDGVYRCAVRVHDAWLRGVMGIDWSRPTLGVPRDTVCLVLSNHVSWSDILVLQSVVSRDGPLLKFLSKRELLWIPIFGIIFWAFDFPVLRRRAKGRLDEATRRRIDAEALAAACEALRRHPAALMSFAEGTRLTPAKHRASGSPYRTLLPPRVGGLAALRAALDDELRWVLDVTLIYDEGASFWSFLCGRVPFVGVDVERIAIEEVPREREALIAWLDARWARKDRLITSARAERGGIATQC